MVYRIYSIYYDDRNYFCSFVYVWTQLKQIINYTYNKTKNWFVGLFKQIMTKDENQAVGPLVIEGDGTKLSNELSTSTAGSCSGTSIHVGRYKIREFDVVSCGTL